MAIGTQTHTKACTAEKGICYCEKCSPGRTERARRYKEFMEIPICRLPAEMLLNILEHIDLISFPAFLIASLHVLRAGGVAPAYPSAMLQIMLLPMEATEAQSASLQTMPQELLLAIGQTLTPNEKIHLVLATYRMRPEEIDLITHLQFPAPSPSVGETNVSTKEQ
ncbi:MAG: hypothetical protein L6R42_003906 [Xanthoria sp. 1 TBL-2021]|nr:MAG: hypothetical protein L6R42_003906 [Xanthoria sp. 1 TBL-2021]